MALTRVAIELPEKNSYGELMKSYLTLMRAFGTELGAVCDSSLRPKFGNWWFQKLMQQRIDENKVRGQRQDLNDPIIVLNELGREHASPIHVALPPSALSIKSAKTIVAKRNELLHFGIEPSLDDIGEVAHLVQIFARHYKLSTDGAIVPLLTRLQKLKRGQYVPQTSELIPAAATPTGPDSLAVAPPPPVEPPAEVEITAELPRPKIGGVWPEPVPPAQYKATKTGDLVSIVTGDSIIDRISGDSRGRLTTWLAPSPKGNLWIAPDGAVGGYVAAVPRLLGYVGDEPPGEIARGFLYPSYLEVAGHRIRDIETGREHEVPAGSETVEGEFLRLTTYGDLIRIDDAGVTRVAIVDVARWTK